MRSLVHGSLAFVPGTFALMLLLAASSGVAHADCPPEHAAMGHCRPAAPPAKPTAPPSKATPPPATPKRKPFRPGAVSRPSPGAASNAEPVSTTDPVTAAEPVTAEPVTAAKPAPAVKSAPAAEPVSPPAASSSKPIAGSSDPAPSVPATEPSEVQAVEPTSEPRETSRDVQPTDVGVAQSSDAQTESIAVSATVAVVAATYDLPLYEGSYQGTIIGASVARGRFALTAKLGAYHLSRNGVADEGIGDLMLHAHATVIERGGFSAGAMLMASVPTGDDMHGYGMGHPMLMPQAWASVTYGGASLGGVAGYSYMMGGAQAHAMHGGGGSWPLVDPMNASEIPFGVHASYAVVRPVSIGAYTEGAAPVGDEMGKTRLAIGGRAMFSLGGVFLTADVAGGVVNGPYGVRGMVSALIPVL